jgi:hypothetical protein
MYIARTVSGREFLGPHRTAEMNEKPYAVAEQVGSNGRLEAASD